MFNLKADAAKKVTNKVLGSACVITLVSDYRRNRL